MASVFSFRLKPFFRLAPSKKYAVFLRNAESVLNEHHNFKLTQKRQLIFFVNQLMHPSQPFCAQKVPVPYSLETKPTQLWPESFSCLLFAKKRIDNYEYLSLSQSLRNKRLLRAFSRLLEDVLVSELSFLCPQLSLARSYRLWIIIMRTFWLFWKVLSCRIDKANMRHLQMHHYLATNIC